MSEWSGCGQTGDWMGAKTRIQMLERKGESSEKCYKEHVFPQVESAAKGGSATEACKQLTGQSCPVRLGLGGILLPFLEKAPLLPSMLHFPQCTSSYSEGER